MKSCIILPLLYIRCNNCQVSTGGLAPSLRDRQTYPRLFRMFTSLAENNHVEMFLFNQFKWKRVAAIVQALDIYTSVMLHS